MSELESVVLEPLFFGLLIGYGLKLTFEFGYLSILDRMDRLRSSRGNIETLSDDRSYLYGRGIYTKRNKQNLE